MVQAASLDVAEGCSIYVAVDSTTGREDDHLVVFVKMPVTEEDLTPSRVQDGRTRMPRIPVNLMRMLAENPAMTMPETGGNRSVR